MKTVISINKYRQHLVAFGFAAFTSGLTLSAISGLEWGGGQDFISPLPNNPDIVSAVEPTPAPKSEKQQILEYIVEKFGDDAANAITLIRKCENSTFDQTRTNHNRNGSIDYGVFQVNDIHESRFGDDFKTDWKANIDAAYEIYKSAGYKFTPWACADVINQTPFWK